MMNQVNAMPPTETPSLETEKGGSPVNKFVPLCDYPQNVRFRG